MSLTRKTPLRKISEKRLALIRERANQPRVTWNPRTCRLKQKKPLKKQSKSMRRRMAEYLPIRDQFLRENPRCAICVTLGEGINPATEVHHLRGRTGTLLVDTRGFVACCRSHREWPHENPRLARGLGLLAPATEWGKPF